MLKGSVMFVEVPQLMWYEDKLPEGKDGVGVEVEMVVVMMNKKERKKWGS